MLVYNIIFLTQKVKVSAEISLTYPKTVVIVEPDEMKLYCKLLVKNNSGDRDTVSQ